MKVSQRSTSLSFYPWFILVLASLMLFYKYLLQVFPSVITKELMQDFQLTGAGLGNLAACYFYSYLLMQFFSGYLIDRFRLKLIIIASILISAFGALLFSLSTSLDLASLSRVLMGMGAAFATVGYMKIAALYFPANRFSLVSGLLTLGVMLGAVFGQAPLGLLIQSQGWHQGLIYIAVAGGIISLLYFVFIKPQTSAPQQTLLIKHSQKITLDDIKNLLKNKTNWCLTLYSGLAFAPMAVFGGLWGTPFVSAAYHMTASKAAMFVSVVYVGFGFGGPLFGYLNERFGQRFRLMTFGLFLSLASLLCVIYLLPSPIGLMCCTFLFGIGTGGFMLGFSVGKDINPLHIAATVIAFINSGDAIFGAFSEPFIGKVLDLTSQTQIPPTHFLLSSYQIAFITLPLELILAYVFLTFVQRSVEGRKQKAHKIEKKIVLSNPSCSE